MKSIKLYLTDFNPNGTNDLIVVDDDGTILAGLDNVTFGFSRSKYDMAMTAHCNELTDTSALTDDELIEIGVTGLYEVEYNELLKHICVSPIDVQGHGIVSKVDKMIKLYTHGNNLNRGLLRHGA
jgi:hypothetical protein